jgi:hypothetical protein
MSTDGRLCASSGKVRYTKGGAREHIRTGFRKRRPIWIYLCPDCGSYHLTSQPPDRRRGVRR